MSHEQPHRHLELTWERSLPLEEAERLYELYLAAFEPLKTLSAVRQVLYRHEFLDEMADPRIEKLVARDTSIGGRAVGLSIMTSVLEAVPWISPEFLAAKFPEQARRGTLYYIAFTLADPAVRASAVYVAMLDVLLRRLTDERAVCVYDICAHNNVSMRFAEHLRMRANKWAVAEEQVLDTQTFYGGLFHEPRPVGARTPASSAQH